MSRLTQERACALLSYNRETGELRWKQSRGGKARAGAVAGAVNSKGYLILSVDRVRYLNHRVVWLMETGTWPEDQIDHKDGVRTNNAFQNLRPCTQFENQQNLRPRSNVTGFAGVCKNHGAFKAAINVNKSVIYLGSYATAEEAGGAYAAAKAKLHKFNPVQRGA